MNEAEEYAIPYLASLTSPKVQKFFILALKIQEDFGLEDLEDLDKVFEMIKSHNKIQRKERTWGYDYKSKLGRELEIDQQIINILEEKINPQVTLKDFQDKTKENLEKCCSGGKNGSSSS